MFTLLCWLSLATIPSVYAKFWFAGKTRNTKHTCYGAVSPLSPEATPTCLGHRSPLLEKHSKKLTDIPANLYAVLNGRGENKENYCPGSKWCHMCKRKFDKEAGTTDVEQQQQQQIYFSHFAY